MSQSANKLLAAVLLPVSGNRHLALDAEIAGLVQRTHTLRKYRTQLLANRAQLYRNILKRSSGRI
jgi:hypothetical protein